MASFRLHVNGKTTTVSVEPGTPLLYVLRNDLELNGPKFGCGLAQCGACTVLMDGKPVRSCVTPVSAAANTRVTTIESLGTLERPHPLQRAFIEEQACQCGYCGNGMVMSAKALLDRNPGPSELEIKQALNGHLCRCASHNRIVRAVQRAARLITAFSAWTVHVNRPEDIVPGSEIAHREQLLLGWADRRCCQAIRWRSG